MQRSLARLVLLAGGLAATTPPACDVTQPTSPDPVVPARDTVAPEVRISYPRANMLLFHDAVEVTVDAIDDQGVTEVALSVQGQSVANDREAPWEFLWQAGGLPQGDYPLRATAYDAAGNPTAHEVTVRLRDAVLTTEIEVTGTSDQILNEALELEVHLYDADAQTFLACSGGDTGLRSADFSNVRYVVEAYLVKPPLGADVLLYDEIAQRNLTLQVTEDDADPCPVPAHTGVGTNFDDLVGTSATVRGDELATAKTMSFGNVVHLVIARGRMRLASAGPTREQTGLGQGGTR